MGLTKVPRSMINDDGSAVYDAQHSPNRWWTYGKDNWVDLDSFIVPIGTYDVHICMKIQYTGALSNGDCFVGLGTASGTGSPNIGKPTYVSTEVINSSSKQIVHHNIGNLDVSSAATYYLKGYATTNSSNLLVETLVNFRPILTEA